MSIGFIIYSGPSAITGAPIVAILTTRSSNSKTGNIPQVWILDASTAPTPPGTVPAMSFSTMAHWPSTGHGSVAATSTPPPSTDGRLSRRGSLAMSRARFASAPTVTRLPSTRTP